jgi:hypothetical protein
VLFSTRSPLARDGESAYREQYGSGTGYAEKAPTPPPVVANEKTGAEKEVIERSSVVP